VVSPILLVSGPSGVGKTTVAPLVAATFDLGVHVRAESFWAFVVSGWVDPSKPESAHQNHVLGGVVAAAAIQFAVGGYSVVVDGTFFPDGADGMAQMCARREVPLHYAVLRADLATCLTRVAQRQGHEPVDPSAFAALHARFADLGEDEASVIDALQAPDDIAVELRSALAAGRLLRAG